jgi:glucosamine-6-phosphate deaminase
VKLITTHGASEFADVAASYVTRAVAENPRLSLTVPTGSTPLGLYQRLRDARHVNEFSLDDATVFMLDEYCDLPSYPERSFVTFLQDHLGEVIFNSSTTRKLLDPAQDPADYDEALDAVGGLDLAIVGVGRNGHVGFNEPGVDPSSRTHVVHLAADTLEANFPDLAPAGRPSRAITIGLADLQRARAILMLVTGQNKHAVADLVAAGIYEANVPATHLLGHDNLTVVMADELLRR